MGPDTAPVKPKRPQRSPPTVLFPFTARLPGESAPGPFRAEPLRARSGHYQPMSSPRQISWNSGDKTNLFFCVTPSFSGLQGAVCWCLAPNTSPAPWLAATLGETAPHSQPKTAVVGCLHRRCPAHQAEIQEAVRLRQTCRNTPRPP